MGVATKLKAKQAAVTKPEMKKNKKKTKTAEKPAKLKEIIDVEVSGDDSQLSLNVDEDTKPCIKNSTIKKAFSVLNQLADIFAKKQNQLFTEEKPLSMQIDCVKIPQLVSRKIRYKLPHWLVTESSEVCLFVKDLKKGKRIDHEPTIQHYEDILKEKGVTMVKGIVPVRQVRVEYDQMEMRRRLLTQYDFFLTDACVSGLLSHRLGKTFFRKKQLPTPLRMDAPDLKKEIEQALHKSVMNVHGNGSSYSLRVANSSHSERDVCENVQAVLLQMVELFPGGWENVRAIHLKYPMSMAIPIYITLKNRNTVKKTVIEPLYKNKIVSGELSTVLNSTVRVHSSGKVFMKRKKTDEGEVSEDEEIPTKKSKEVKNKKNESVLVKSKENPSKIKQTAVIEESNNDLSQDKSQSDDDDSDENEDTSYYSENVNYVQENNQDGSDDNSEDGDDDEDDDESDDDDSANSDEDDDGSDDVEEDLSDSGNEE